MKLWYSAAELAALALPGLPERQESIIRFAERSGWNRDRRLARPRGGRGGGMEYRIELLPIEARMGVPRSTPITRARSTRAKARCAEKGWRHDCGQGGYHDA